jgi:hypothetical protein
MLESFAAYIWLVYDHLIFEVSILVLLYGQNDNADSIEKSLVRWLQHVGKLL